MPPLPITAVFDAMADPRRDTENKLHLLTDILAIESGVTKRLKAG